MLPGGFVYSLNIWEHLYASEAGKQNDQSLAYNPILQQNRTYSPTQLLSIAYGLTEAGSPARDPGQSWIIACSPTQ